MPRPRILFLDHTASLGGAELALLRLVRELDHARFDVGVVLFSDGPLAGPLRAAGAWVEVLPLAEGVVNTSRNAGRGGLLRFATVWETLGFVWRLAEFIRSQRINVVHSNSLKAGIIGGVAARLAGRRFLWHLHDRIAADYLTPRVAWVLTFLIRRLPHFLITNSQATLVTVAPYAASRCEVIYPGVEVDSAAVEVAVPAPGKLIGLVGRISRTKGQDVFLRAAAEAVKHFPGTRFQIIGGALFNDAPFEAEVRELTSTLGLDEVVEFTGFVQNVGERIAALDVLVHASPTPEPFGQVAAEGMAAGKPVVATRAGGIPEIVTHEETGLLVEPGSVEGLAAAMCRLLADPAFAASLGARGRERVAERFSIGRTAREVEQVYARLLGMPAVVAVATAAAASILKRSAA